MTRETAQDRIARAICAEKCAFYGEPPCYRIAEWPNEACDEPGCMALALAVLAVAPVSEDQKPTGDTRLARTDEDIAALLEWVEVPHDEFRDKYLDDPTPAPFERREP